MRRISSGAPMIVGNLLAKAAPMVIPSAQVNRRGGSLTPPVIRVMPRRINRAPSVPIPAAAPMTSTAKMICQYSAGPARPSRAGALARTRSRTSKYGASGISPGGVASGGGRSSMAR